MNTSKVVYSITIIDEMFGEFTGEFEAGTFEEACMDAKEFYALEMDTNSEEIEILAVSIKQS